MAIDLEALAAKHAQLSNPTAGSSTDFLKNFFQVVEGTNIIRILPGKDEDTLFYAETKIHRVPDGEGRIRNMHCRKVHGEQCPMCDAYYGLWKTGNKEDEDMGRQVKPRSRYYMNVVDRESGEVKILSVGVILFKKIIATMLDEDFGDITDTSTGHDFKIVKIMDGQWPKYDQSQPRPKAEPAGSTAEIASYMDSLHDIHALVKLEEYDTVREAAHNLLPSLAQNAASRTYTEATQSSDTSSDDNYLKKIQS
jgi:hypothetical protein